MPVVTRADCTQVNVEEEYTFTFDPVDGFTGVVNHVSVAYQACQGANNSNNNLSAFVEQLNIDGKLSNESKAIVDSRIVGNNNCPAVRDELFASKSIASGYEIDTASWTYVIGEGFDNVGDPIMDARLFKAMFEALEVPIVRRVCPSCSGSHRDIYYRRLTPMPDDFDLLDTLMNNWMSLNNTLNVDFALYSTSLDAYYDVNRWTYCNYDDPGVGFPRDCGPTNRVNNNWNAYYRGGGMASTHAFLLPANPDGPTAVNNIALGKPTRQSEVKYDGSSDIAVDGNTVGIQSFGGVTHTEHHISPYWQVDLEHNATINKVYFWNRIDCCRDRLKNVHVDVYDTPYGSVVQSIVVEDASKVMNVVDFGGVTGQAVRIWIDTGSDRGTLSLAEVQIDGVLDGAPVQELFAHVNAGDYSEQSGTYYQNVRGPIGWFDSGDYLQYNRLDFGPPGTTNSILISYAKSHFNGNSKLELRLNGVDGLLIGEFVPPSTGSWSTYELATINIDAVSGVHDVYFVGAGTSGILNFEWFELSDDWAFRISTAYKVDDNLSNARDVQCTYDTLFDAFSTQVYPHLVSDGSTEVQMFHQYLDASTVVAAKSKVTALCADAQQTIRSE